MTSHELVRRAIEFGGPERLAVQCPALGINDTFGVGCRPAEGWQPSKLKCAIWASPRATR